MLLTRVLTAAALLPLVVGAIFFLPSAGIAVILAVFFVLGAWEWGGFMQLEKTGRAIFSAVVALSLLTAWCLLSDPLAVQLFLAVGLLWWLYAANLVMRFPRGWDVSVGVRPVAGVIGCVILVSAFVAVLKVHAHENGSQWLLLLFLFMWAADTGAYFAGRGFGRHKLAPKVSPGKTLEGALGGVLACTVVALAAAFWFELPLGRSVLLVVLGLVLAPVSILGDLTESMFKRQAGIKDSGQIFPGHGGVLDRLDSLFAAAPFFLVGLILLDIPA